MATVSPNNTTYDHAGSLPPGQTLFVPEQADEPASYTENCTPIEVIYFAGAIINDIDV